MAFNIYKICLIIVFTLHFINTEQQQRFQGYNFGDVIKLECKNKNGTWGPGLICQDTRSELNFTYGNDQLVFCNYLIRDKEHYDQLVRIANREESWHCRIKTTPVNNMYYLPVTIPVMAYVEPKHMHVIPHMSFVFHAFQGVIMGLAIYPVLDHHAEIIPGAMIPYHGPVRWFQAHTFNPLGRGGIISPSLGGDSSRTLLWCVLVFLVTLLGAVLSYQFYLKPNMIRKLQKKIE